MPVTPSEIHTYSLVYSTRSKLPLVQHFKFDDTRVKIIGLGKSPKPDETNKVEILIYR